MSGEILLNDVGKVFPKAERASLDAVSFDVGAGRVCALLGGNGAGKTTTLRILTTLTTPTSGVARVNGFDVVEQAAEVRASIGVVGQYAAVDEVLTAPANLEMFGRLLGLTRASARTRAVELLELVGLSEHARKPVGTYSGGMRRRLDLVASMISRPVVLFIDEPTTGLDPIARQDIWAAVRHLVEEGTTVLLTTQYLEEADELADDVVILRDGSVIAAGTRAQLKALAGEPRMELREPTLQDVYLHLHEDPAA